MGNYQRLLSAVPELEQLNDRHEEALTRVAELAAFLSPAQQAAIAEFAANFDALRHSYFEEVEDGMEQARIVTRLANDVDRLNHDLNLACLALWALPEFAGRDKDDIVRTLRGHR